jgi:putative transposase
MTQVFCKKSYGATKSRLKTCTIKKDSTGTWYVVFVIDTEAPVAVEPHIAVGVDLEISHAVVTSDGQYFDYPGYYVLAQRQNRMANKSLHRNKKGSQNRKKAQHRLYVILLREVLECGYSRVRYRNSCIGSNC